MKMQAREIPEGESDGEYETVPKKLKKKSPPKTAEAPTPAPVISEQPIISAEAVAEPLVPNATDDDWLRSRTNRLLDLMDPEDIVGGRIGGSTSQNIEAVAETSASVEGPVNLDEETIEEEQEEEEKPDPTIEAIKSNGRLFVRNLPYSASEDDLRQHFEPYGALEEVCISPFVRKTPMPFHDEYPDRDSLCSKHVM